MIPNAILFDAYGTLLDVSGPGRRLADKYGDVANDIGARVRLLQITYSWHSSMMGKYAPFFDLTRHAVKVAMAEHGFQHKEFLEEFMEGFAQIEAFPDVAETLLKLKEQGVNPVILSNGEHRYLERAFFHAGVIDLLAGIITVEEIKIFKPTMDVYRHAQEKCLVRGFVSSNPWGCHWCINLWISHLLA
jgi:Haloacid dehalogenase superfamily, subfamily IA, variant 2 with 3rd motif like haloacid dehalogenase